jgi:uncharacterized protein HemX
VNVPSIVATAASGVVVLGALAHITRKVVRFFQNVAAAAKTAASRSAQLEPNGGSSLRDAVNRIEEVLAQQNEHLAEQDKHLRQQDETIAALQSRQPRWRRY